MGITIGRSYVLTAASVIVALIHLYAPVFGLWSGLRSVSVAGFLAIAFLLFPLSLGAAAPLRVAAIVIDLALIAAAIFIGYYVSGDYGAFQARAGQPTDMDLILGCALIVIILEGTRRALGWPLVILSGLAIAYAVWGRSFPLAVAHGGADTFRLVNQLFVLPSGIYGLAVGVTATYIVIFVLFGALLERSGAAALFMEWARRLFGHRVAGPAKMAVVSSALMGSMSGSAVANVVTTGSFTIPLMKQLGFKPKRAAAIEACASTGGMILPPVMGAAAFILAESLGVGYGSIVIAAALPAILYFLTLYLLVDLEGRKNALHGLPPARETPIGDLVGRSWWLVIPIILLFVMLLQQYSAMRAAFAALGSLAFLVIVLKGPREGIRCIHDALRDGAQLTVPIALACACAGIIVGVIHMTGLGLRFTSIVLNFAGDSAFAALLLTMVITVILGMGLPATAAYITTAALAVPVLLALGIPDLSAHMFVFYFAAFSAITPPVALATFAAAGIAKANMWASGLEGVRLGIVGYIIPFFFVYSPALLILGSEPQEIAAALITAPFGVAAISCAIVGYASGPLHIVSRAGLMAAGLLLVHQGFGTFLLALVAISVVALFELWRRKRVEGAALRKHQA